MRKFDQKILVGRLERLPEPSRAAFAASAAGRLTPAYARYCEVTNRGDPMALLEAMQVTWNFALGETVSIARVTECEANVHALTKIPETPPISGHLYICAEDATAAATYCLRSILTHDAKNAARAASSSYDAAYQFSANSDTVGPKIVGLDDVDRWLAHPLVQSELDRQERDLIELESAASEKVVQVIRRMRERVSGETVIPVESL